MCIYNTLYYEVSKIPPWINSRVLEWGSGSILDLWHPSIIDPRRFWFLELLFLCWNLQIPPTSDIYGSYGSMYLESLVPIVFGTFQSARNFGHWKAYHFRTRISTCIYGTVRVMTALFKAFQKWCAKRRSAVFCVRIAMWKHNRLQGRRGLKR